MITEELFRETVKALNDAIYLARKHMPNDDDEERQIYDDANETCRKAEKVLKKLPKDKPQNAK